MDNHDDIIERVSTTLKEPVKMDPALDARIMAEVEAMPESERESALRLTIGQWFREPRPMRFSPLAGLAAAATIAVVGIGLGRWSGSTATTPSAANFAAQPAPSSFEFVLVAPAASNVSVVGDFNDWDLGSTPLNRVERNGMWSVVVPLAPGRHRYSFVVDGTIWTQDPGGTPAVDDEFGRPNSVLTIGGIS
jgi:hypothetical protein